MQTVTYDELSRMRKDVAIGREDFALINVLGRESFNERHIPGSINAPYEDDERFVNRVKDAAGSKERKIVVYCAGPSCDDSRKAAKKLSAEGFSHVYAYEGGNQEWFERRQKQAA